MKVRLNAGLRLGLVKIRRALINGPVASFAILLPVRILRLSRARLKQLSDSRERTCKHTPYLPVVDIFPGKTKQSALQYLCDIESSSRGATHIV